MSLLCFVIGIISCILFKNKTRAESDSQMSISKKEEKKSSISSMFDFAILKNWRFLLWCMINNLLEGAYNVPYFFLPCKKDITLFHMRFNNLYFM